jgi:hypothetical protein
MAVNETKREVKRAYLNYGKLLDPIAIFALIILVVTPIFAVINLSTKTLPAVYKTEKTNTTVEDERFSVLGVKSNKEFGIELTTGTHKVIQTTLLDTVDQNSYKLEIEINKHEAGTYSRPVLNVYNKTNKEVQISISPFEVVGTSLINTVFDESRQRLFSINSGLSLVTYTIKPNDEKELYLEVYSVDDINFQDELALDIYMNTLEQ